MADPGSDEAKQVLNWLKQAETETVSPRTDKEKVKLARRSWAAYDEAMAPFLKEEMTCAKFGLVVFYLLAELEAQEIYLFAQGSLFDRAQQAIFSSEGTVVEIANIDALDASAQKQGRRLLRALRGLGYFREAVAA
ncbi:MAG: hypothetical protein KIS86_12980 [Devosia sp.]|nr:hypothetical protein [Devosia sp.]